MFCTCVKDFFNIHVYNLWILFQFSIRYKDAIILSPHKFVGGPGTPGKTENITANYRNIEWVNV